MMHGTFQFHAVSAAYFLLGDSDFSARVPAVLFSIASLAFIWFFRRYLGVTGMLFAAVLFVISPYMLYYGRYVRNESYVVFFGLVALWAVLRYLEDGHNRHLLLLTVVTALHFTTKETSFIYAAQMLVFLGLLFLSRVTRQEWQSNRNRTVFLICLMLAIALFGLAISEIIFGGQTLDGGEPTLAEPAVPGQDTNQFELGTTPLVLTVLPATLGILASVIAIYFLIKDLGSHYLRSERSFGLILLLATLVLPQLSPIPVRFMGWSVPDTPGAIQSMTGSEVLHFVVFLVPMIFTAVLIGLWWHKKLWLLNAAVFYAIFIFLYTTGFTNPSGVISGLVGSLGYWMAQQEVQRGSQPWYYYLLIQIPVYEYLVFTGSLIGVGIFTRQQLKKPLIANDETDVAELPGADEYQETQPEQLEISPISNESPVVHNPSTENGNTLALYLFIFWFFSSLVAYTVAGEKMPWLTVHIVLPMILLGGWGFAQIFESIHWTEWRNRQGWLMILTLIIFLLSVFGVLGALLGTHPPFRSRELEDLRNTTRFIGQLVLLGAAGWGIYHFQKFWSFRETLKLSLLVMTGMGALLTARTAFQASYVNYDEGTEFLVYAHSARGVKDVMSRLEEISQRTTDGPGLRFGYDDDTSWPMTWYARNFYNHRYYGNQPGRDLRDLPVIIVGDNNFGSLEPVVGQAYYMFEYIRMVWPNQDYFGLTWSRIFDALTDPAIRQGLFEIWYNRDFTAYGQAVGKEITRDEWSPADRMRMYIRKDVAALMWEYGTGPAPEEVVADPYEGGEIDLVADTIIGQPGSEPGSFNYPHDLAVAADGSLYIADSDNHRIQHLTADGEVLHTWGSYGDLASGAAPGGTFNQPWGLAIGPDGAVYVADTWNHRIQKFTPEGEFLLMWGYFGQAEAPEAFWGPRDVVVDEQGRVFVSDTGNKRVVVFDEYGQYLNQFGGFGLEPGFLDEPVGLAISPAGQLYVADTWNQRIQIFQEVEETFQLVNYWDVAAWYGQSLENKPYLAVDEQGNIFATDPENPRVIQFDAQGQFVRYWGKNSSGADGFGLAAAVAVNPQGGVWVSDARNNRLLHFSLP
jgi:uncharacterized protein (TIGR03663 family)